MYREADLTNSDSDPSIVLWLGAGVVAMLGSRVFAEYLRRVHYEGVMRIWKEWLLGATALAIGIWSSMIVSVTAQNVGFALGYHPLRLFGGLAFGWGLAVVVMYWIALKPGRWALLGAGLLASITILLLQIAVVWSIGAEPGLLWRPEPLLFALVVVLAGLGTMGFIVLSPRRGSPGDRRSRRLIAGLAMGAAVTAAAELVLVSSGLTRQGVSAYARVMPDMIVALVAGTVIPAVLGLMFADEYMQAQARASARRPRRKRSWATAPSESCRSFPRTQPSPERAGAVAARVRRRGIVRPCRSCKSRTCASRCAPRAARLPRCARSRSPWRRATRLG